MLDQCLQHFCENVSPGVGRVFLETQVFQVVRGYLKNLKKFCLFSSGFEMIFRIFL